MNYKVVMSFYNKTTSKDTKLLLAVVFLKKALAELT